jgi:hypothetical protein
MIVSSMRLVFLTSTLFVLSKGYTTPAATSATRRGSRGPRGGSVQPNGALYASVDNDVAVGNQRWPKNKNKGTSKNKLSSPSRHKNRNARNGEAIQLNKKIIAAETASDVISLLASTPNALTKTSGGGALNSVNFATSIHRIGRYLAYNNHDRAATLSDPKFALFLCSFAEALAGLDYTQQLSSVVPGSDTDASSGSRIVFNTRERANLVWALAKLRIVPPSSSVPLQHSESIKEALVTTSIKLRNDIIDSLKTGDKSWIASLSLLSAQLMDTVSYMMMEELHEESKSKTQEMVNMIWAFAAANRSADAVFELIGLILANALEALPETPKPQEFSNTIWAFATAGYTGKAQDSIISLIVSYLEEDPTWISKFKPQELSNTAWGLAILLNMRRESGQANSGTSEQEEADSKVVTILRHVAREIVGRCDDFKSQEVSNTVWSFGTLGFGIGAETAEKRNLNDFIILKSDDYDADEALVNEVLAAVRVSVPGRIRVFKEQELNNMAHGCARLDRCEPELFTSIARDFARRRGRLTGQDIGATLWAFASTKFYDEDSFANLLSRLRMNDVQYWKPQEISNIIWAIGTAGISPKYRTAFDCSLIPADERISFEQASQDPFTLAFAAAAKEILRRPEEFKTQEMKDTLWGFSKAGVRHPLMFRSVAEYLVGRETDKVPVGQLHTGVGLDKFSPQELANLCWSYAKQGQLAAETSENLNGRMAVYCASAVDYGETLTKRLMNCAAEANLSNHGDSSRLSPNDLSNTIWSLATLGCSHDRFMAETEKEMVIRCQNYVSGKDRSLLNNFCGQQLCNIVWSLATLNNLKPATLDGVVSYVEMQCQDERGSRSAKSIAKFLNRQELGNIAWSCSVAGHYPPALIRIVIQGLLGEGDERTPEYMDEVHEQSGGLTEHSVMSLLYLFYSMQVDDALVEGVELPVNFPNGWGDCGQGDILDDESGMSLSLTTSRIQQTVAAAFTRVGLDHVEEYIVPTDIGLNLLSLDIADPSRKLAIEVDGPSHYYHNLDNWSPQDPPKGQVFRMSGRKVEYSFDWNAERNLPNGSTSLKNRILEKLGWTVVRVPFWDWYAMNGLQEAEDEYCRNILKGL